MGYAYSDDNADLSSTHVKDIVHHSPVRLALSHQGVDVFVISIFHMIGERTTISSWHNKDYLIGWTDF